MSAKQLTREQVMALPPVISLATLAEALGVSEPTIRQCHRRGEMERLGIRVNKIGAQHRVVTASVWVYFGLSHSASSAPAGSNGAGQDQATGPAIRSLRGAAS